MSFVPGVGALRSRSFNRASRHWGIEIGSPFLPAVLAIAGWEGDRLSYDAQGNLWVGTQKIGKAKTQSKEGRQLTPIKAGIIPPGMVFVKGEHERSFDSRYEELGLIPEAALGGRVLGLV